MFRVTYADLLDVLREVLLADLDRDGVEDALRARQRRRRVRGSAQVWREGHADEVVGVEVLLVDGLFVAR